MRHHRLFILLLLSVLSVTSILAQQNLSYSFRHISQTDGLLHNDVLSITQDGKGFIWIATINGLQRYDGLNFVNYTDKLTRPELGFSAGADMYADKKTGVLWLQNKNITEKMEPGKNNFSLYDADKALSDSAAIFTPFREANNQLWLLSNSSFYYYDSSAKKYILTYLNIHPANTYQSAYMTTDNNDNTWFENYPVLYLINKKNKTIYSSKNNPGSHPLLQAVADGMPEKNSERFVFTDSRQNVWATTWWDKFYRYDNSTGKVTTYSLAAIKGKQGNGKITSEDFLINYILEDDHHTIWIATENTGLLRYNNEKDNFDYCTAQENNRSSIQYNYKIYSLFQDKEQNIWVSTDKGISIFNPYRQNFHSIRHQEGNPLSISKNEIDNFIQIPGGDILIGTWGGGLALYDQHFNFKKNISFPGNPDKNKVWSFSQVDNETIWIGCQHGYLLVYNTTTGNTQTLQPPEMEKKTIRCMEKDNKGNILFGLHSGEIVKWDKQQQKFFACRDTFKIIDPLVNIFIDNTQHCWVSTPAGFKEFDTEKMVFTDTWLPDKKNTTSIFSKNSQGIEEYNDSTILIGTVHGGLNFFNKRTKTFSHLTTADGLPSNTIYALKKDAAGYIWFTTDYGLYKINPADKKIIPYSIEPGLINSSFKANKFYQLQDRQWLTFTSTEAISFFPYKAAFPESLLPKTEITGFKIFGKPVAVDSIIDGGKPIRLPYSQNFFTVEFASLIFSGQQQTNYYHRLIGLDKDWVNDGATRIANYTGLQPGEYTFEVKAENNNNSGKITSFKIIITPPWWKTKWFISLVVLGTLLITSLLLRWRIKNIKAIAAEKLKVQQLNAKQFKNKLELEPSLIRIKWMMYCGMLLQI
jgi:ligand-binding sensor domain-containing protein